MWLFIKERINVTFTGSKMRVTGLIMERCCCDSVCVRQALLGLHCRHVHGGDGRRNGGIYIAWHYIVGIGRSSHPERTTTVSLHSISMLVLPSSGCIKPTGGIWEHTVLGLSSDSTGSCLSSRGAFLWQRAAGLQPVSLTFCPAQEVYD